MALKDKIKFADQPAKSLLKQCVERCVEYIPNWAALQKISTNRIVQSAYLFLFVTPMAARVVQELPDKLTLSVGSGYVFTTSLPFSWLWLFWAAIGASLANAIYALWCPEIIKRFNDYSDFEKSRRGANPDISLVDF